MAFIGRDQPHAALAPGPITAAAQAPGREGRPSDSKGALLMQALFQDKGGDERRWGTTRKGWLGRATL